MSVEQKIRELCKELAASSGGLDDSGRDEGLENELVENTTQALLQIIESDVIEPIEKGHGGGNWRRLVVQVRANLREDK
jgi:hypothetical protein